MVWHVLKNTKIQLCSDPFPSSEGKLFTVGNTKDLAKFHRGRCSLSGIARACVGVCACVLGRGVLQSCKDEQLIVCAASRPKQTQEHK